MAVAPPEHTPTEMAPTATARPSGSIHEPWALTSIEASMLLQVDPVAGLGTGEARTRLTRTGPNQLEGAPRRPSWKLFLDQFRSTLVLILVGAAIVAGLVGDVTDTAVIAVVLVLNAVLGFLQENKAERSLTALRSMLTPIARVRRDGVAVIIDAADLVPGDVLLLEAGDRIAADGRFVLLHGVDVDESSLTGESTPVTKALGPVPAASPLADRSSMGFTNTTVTRGRGELVVTATGMQTEIGRLAGLLQTTETADTPLQRQIHHLSLRLALVAAVAVSVFFLLGVARGDDLADTLLSSVALAVAAIPEGLPAILTVTLAIGVSQMAKRGAIVKHLASVETLGCTSVICSDKTGTLTLNVMTATSALVAGRSVAIEVGTELTSVAPLLAPIAVPMALCSDARMADGQLVGDPTEGALVVLAGRLDIDVDALRAARPRIAEVPFDAARKLMVTFHEAADGGADLYVKGALDALLPRCGQVLGADGAVPLDEAAEALDAWMQTTAAKGQRVLALAVGELPSAADVRARAEEGQDALLELVDGLVIVGLVGLVDPPRREAKEAIAVARRAGVDFKMITGDHAVTAMAIAHELGIRGRTISGVELEAMTDLELQGVVDEVGVFARVAPEHKLRIVRALQAKGHVVAMTGDGVNDAPALKQADVGVAMGITGTEVSKEAASMVLIDDDVSSIVRAIEQGRAIYANIVTFVRFQLATNLGAIGSLVGAPLVGLPVPFTAVEVLWVNLIMDGPPAIALGVDPPKADAMAHPPRDPKAAILSSRRLSVLVLSGFVMTAGTLGVLAWAQSAYDEATALTMAFTTFVLFQVANALNARHERSTVFHADTLRNLTLWVALGGVVVLQVAAVHLSAGQRLFDTVALTATQWGIAIAVASSILWVEEVRKFVLRRRAGGQQRIDPSALVPVDQSLAMAIEESAALDDLTDPTPDGPFAQRVGRMGRAARFLVRSSRRLVVGIAGGALLIGGVAMLVLPGPGLLVIAAGLAVLAREFVWAERALASVRRRATQAARAATGALRRS